MPSYSFEQQAYEVNEIWEDGWFSEGDRKRINAIAELICKDTGSLLDIGCGNGLFVRHISDMRDEGHFHNLSKISAVDRSGVALQKINNKTIDITQANIDNLPYADDSYDTVTCLEVIEHLPLQTYSKALDEIYRIARSNIVVSVPFDQDIANSLTTCRYCHTKFNADFHMRSFNESQICNLFEYKNIKAKEIIYIGRVVKHSELILKMLLFFRKPSFPSYAICPVCGYNEHHKLKSDLALRRSSNTIKNAVKRLLPKKAAWIVGVYEKNRNN